MCIRDRDCSLQPDYTKLESLVIANQHVAVNTFPGLVPTARHTMGVSNALSLIHIFMNQYIPMLIIFGISGILGVTIIYELRRMMKTVMEEECFVTANVTNLRHMARLSFGITILWIIKLFFNPTPAALVIIIVFFIAALFSQVLACVFNQAIAYKEENDFTI